MADVGIDIGTGVRLRTSNPANPARITPANPPLADSVADSTRNW